MFYKTGVDITNDRQMFEFLKNHFTYSTLNSWNGLSSIANNVKMYNLKLSGDWWIAHQLLEAGEYDTISFMIQDWERDHRGYEVYFNGRSNGYLILKRTDYNGNMLPDSVFDSDTYEDYKDWCRENYGSVKANRDELVRFTKLVQDFDKLCDSLRDFCDELSNMDFTVVEMETAVEQFNDKYCDDLELLGFSLLECNDGVVDISEIQTLTCLFEAFCKLADRKSLGFRLSVFKGNAQLVQNI